MWLVKWNAARAEMPVPYFFCVGWLSRAVVKTSARMLDKTALESHPTLDNFEMNPATQIAKIRKELEALGHGSRQGHRPSAQIDFGVYTADLRGVVRKFKKELKVESGELVLQIGDGLIDEKVTECRQVAYELIAGHKEARESLDEATVIKLGRQLDNWCCVDNFCSNIAGAAWREGLVSDSLITKWSQSDDLWLRRCAVVCTVALNTKSRGGTGDPERTTKVCEALISDPEIMVQKAISWALREVIPWDRVAVEAFLDQHDNHLSALVKREVQKKLITGKKNG